MAIDTKSDLAREIAGKLADNAYLCYHCAKLPAAVPSQRNSISRPIR